MQHWIDRVLENKLKIKSQLHLGTEFEFTRFTNAKGKPIDPFVPKFDIMKVRDLDKELVRSQKINVESPRFIATLERALIELFEKADKDHSSELNYQEFYDAFKSFSYDLTDNDIRTLMALADENCNGKISWREFIPVGISSIQTFLARNKKLKKETQFAKEVNKDTLKLLYDDQIVKTAEIFLKRFEK